MSFYPTAPPASRDFSGTLAAALNSVVTVSTVGMGSIGFYLNVPTGATVSFQSTFDGSTWESCTLRATGTDGYLTSATTSGRYIGSVGSAKQFRAIVTVAGSAPGSISGSVAPFVHTIEGQEHGPPDTFLLTLAQDRIPNHASEHKFGRNGDVDAGAEETVWGGDGLYTFSAAAETWYVSSDSTSDTAVQVTIEGLDGNYAARTATVTLTGRTAAAFSGTWLRINRAYVSGSTLLVGTAYIANTATNTAGVPALANQRGVIAPDNQQTVTTVYTVPAGKTAYLVDYSAEASTGNVDLRLRVREFGGVFRTRSRKNVNAGTQVTVTYGAYLRVPEKSDLKFDALSSANNTVVSVDYDLFLVDN